LSEEPESADVRGDLVSDDFAPEGFVSEGFVSADFEPDDFESEDPESEDPESEVLESEDLESGDFASGPLVRSRRSDPGASKRRRSFGPSACGTGLTEPGSCERSVSRSWSRT
jgi:hypothetical protein